MATKVTRDRDNITLAIEDFDRDKFEATVYAEGTYCFRIGNKVVAVMPAEVDELIRFLQTSRGQPIVQKFKPEFCQ